MTALPAQEASCFSVITISGGKRLTWVFHVCFVRCVGVQGGSMFIFYGEFKMLSEALSGNISTTASDRGTAQTTDLENGMKLVAKISPNAERQVA